MLFGAASLHKLCRDPMQAESSDPMLPLNAEGLEEFAQRMVENIIRSFLKLEPKVATSNENLEMFAEEFVSAVMEVALREVCTPGGVEEHVGDSKRFGVKMNCEETESRTFVEKPAEEENLVDTEMDQVKDVQTSRDTQYRPSLCQSGLLVVGSLDYPDAPPTTPLIPELERSRRSFARKLKGGLAKVFLPSPPPPTPKDKEDMSSGAIGDTQTELMEHLMHSLSFNEMARDGANSGALQRAGVEAFAENLSSSIVNWVFNVIKSEQKTNEHHLHLLALQLAETIITSSLDEARTPV